MKVNWRNGVKNKNVIKIVWSDWPGLVGWAVVHGLSPKYLYSAYDIIGEYEWDNILLTDIVFICVSTPANPFGRLDCTAVNNVLNREIMTTILDVLL